MLTSNEQRLITLYRASDSLGKLALRTWIINGDMRLLIWLGHTLSMDKKQHPFTPVPPAETLTIIYVHPASNLLLSTVRQVHQPNPIASLL